MAKLKPQAPSVVPLTKVMVPLEESSPEHGPLFINHCQISNFGHDVYLDIGVVPVDDVINPQHGKGHRFFVLQRLVMSAWTLATLKPQVDSMLTALGGLGINVGQMQTEIAALTAKIERASTRTSRKPKQRDKTKSL